MQVICRRNQHDYHQKYGASRVQPDIPSYPDFVQPTGAHDAYQTGDIVNYNGVLYKSKINNNVWAPDVYPSGWEVYEG